MEPSLEIVLKELSGWIPALILPTAAIFQLVRIVKNRSGKDVSLVAWILFGIANIGLYIFSEKYLALQSILGLLGTAAINFAIVFVVLYHRRQESKAEQAIP